MQLFHYLHYGLSAILVFVGAKMLLADIYKIPVGMALGMVAGILLVAIVVSMMRPRKVEVVTAPADNQPTPPKPISDPKLRASQ
jgi:tellurite resistance protein TerC